MSHSRSSSEASTSRNSLDGVRKKVIERNEGNGASANLKAVNGVNGKGTTTAARHSDELKRAEQLQAELEKVTQEKESMTNQYNDLLSKMNTLKTTLGTKLRQFAEELDRREHVIQQMTVQNDDLQQTIETLQSEVLTSNAEAERSSKELMSLRQYALEESSEEALTRERELREAQVELEHCRTERDEWERETQECKVLLEEYKSALAVQKRDFEQEQESRQRAQRELEMEKEKSNNLQSVLEDFQLAKDHELREAVRDREAQLTQVTQSLAEYKHRAHTAELQLEETSADTSKTAELEKQVKEKGRLVEKLRHEAVILNEHLMEALRRLRKNSADNNVDRRLVSNVLLQFLTTNRADSKRFEMLGLLGTILSWNDNEREKAGLQRSLTTTGRQSGSRTVSASSVRGKASELDNSDETESFSQRWVEFLLKEANDSTSLSPSSLPLTPTRTNSNQSLPGSPRSGPGSPSVRTTRLASFTSLAMASSPNLPQT